MFLQSIEALRFFKGILRNTEESAQGTIRFTASIVFNKNGEDINAITPVAIELQGINAGRVLLESETIPPDIFLREFHPQWQKYKFHPDDSLKITGNSEEFGAFMITIEEHN
jgi:hypothetical protein